MLEFILLKVNFLLSFLKVGFLQREGSFVFPLALSVLGLIGSWYALYKILQQKEGDGKEKEVGDIIRNASFVYLNHQYKIIFAIVFVLLVPILLLMGKFTAIGFLGGSALSCLAGFYSMYVSLKSNIRTTLGAKNSLSEAFSVAFMGGYSAGLYINSLALLFLMASVCAFLFFGWAEFLMPFLNGFSLGASLVCVFARIGGGIFTKGADVGADLVGKVETGLPEDDPRNPAVIADNVGDNVGDCAGMAADIFESYSVTVIACFGVIVLGNQFIENFSLLLLPFYLCASGILASMLAKLFIKKEEKNPWGSLTKYFYLSTFFCFILSKFFIANTLTNIPLFEAKAFACMVIGLLTVVGLLKTTEYYTSTEYAPVQEIAKSSLGGGGTNVIFGLSYSFSSVLFPILLVVTGILLSYNLLGFLGIGLSVVSIISLSPTIMTLDCYGPITDNAGGICEMANLPTEARERTDILDRIGNTTKALTKGYAIGSASFASILLFVLFLKDLDLLVGIKIICDCTSPEVLCGFMIGMVIPFVFSGLGMRSVGKAGAAVVEEVRKQIKDRPGILDGSQAPDYGSTIRYLTNTAIKEMILPSLIPVIFVVTSFLVSRYLGGVEKGFIILASVMIGTFLGGVFLSIGMTTAGGAWDNAKKYIELGHFGGKNSSAHKAAVIGDTVGDPYKDTVGTALNAVIKLVNLLGISILYCLK